MQYYEIGMVGLGVMGRNLLLNMADSGYSIAGYDKDPAKVEALQQDSGKRDILGATNVKEFIKKLRKPRAIMMMVPAGAPVDAVIKDLLPHLDKGDLIIDAGNSYFKDTDFRSRNLEAKGIHFMGVGVSGGEEGARHGASIMPGGPKESYERVRPIFEAVAAKVKSEPCVTWLGPGSAGHFVKMVHNGIEYGIMQLIAEAYDLMKRSLGMNNDEMHEVFASWNKGELKSYLVEITSHIFSKKDNKSGNKLLDEIVDVARQKGTGMWTSQSAMELQAPVPTIDLAVAMRDMSVITDEREQAGVIFKQTIRQYTGNRDIFLMQLGHSLYTAIIITYSQGMALLKVASEKYEYHLNLAEVARIWRGGCIIRSRLLDDLRSAFRKKPDLPNILLNPKIAYNVMEHHDDFIRVICQAAESGVPVPGLMVSLSYLHAWRSSWLPANLIQAQRDYFGAHTYERIDEKGTFHTEWKNGN